MAHPVRSHKFYRQGTVAFEERRDAWKVCRKSITYFDQANQLKQIRAAGLLRLANFFCCQDVLRRLDKTFQAFFALRHLSNVLLAIAIILTAKETIERIRERKRQEGLKRFAFPCFVPHHGQSL